MGRRGLILHLKGWAWVCYGIAFVTDVTPGPFSDIDTPVIFELPNSHAWGLLWIVFGTFSALSAVAANWWNTRVAQVGWTISIIPPIIWACIFAWRWVIHQVLGCPISLGWLALAGFWALVAFIVRVLAGWDEPRTPAEVVADRAAPGVSPS